MPGSRALSASYAASGVVLVAFVFVVVASVVPLRLLAM